MEHGLLGLTLLVICSFISFSVNFLQRHLIYLIPEIVIKKRYQKTITVFSDASDMKFDTKFFWYWFLVTNRTML